MTFMKNHLLRAVSLIAWLGFASAASAAEVGCNRSSPFDLIITVRGAIAAGDAKRVEDCWRSTQPNPQQLRELAAENKKTGEAFEQVTPVHISLAVSSNGGLVSEAMRIGRFSRKHGVRVVIPMNSECLSSCVYILAGGVTRWAFGTVGIHRPYFAAPPAEGYNAALRRTLKASREYFEEMNVPAVLADDMFSVPPEDMRILGDQLLAKYRLNQVDMAYQEERDMANARRYGLSRQEYMKRSKLAERLFDACESAYTEPDWIERYVYCWQKAHREAGLVEVDR